MRALFVLALLAVLFSAAPAHAANMPNASCSMLGETRMSDNQNDIIACLCPSGTSGVNCSGKTWKAMTSASPITCTKNVAYGFSGSRGYTFAFTAAECGGVLPDSNYTGVMKVEHACDGMKASWVVDAGVSVSSVAGNAGPAVTGPAVGGYFLNPCTWSSGYQASFQAVFVHK